MLCPLAHTSSFSLTPLFPVRGVEGGAVDTNGQEYVLPTHQLPDDLKNSLAIPDQNNILPSKFQFYTRPESSGDVGFSPKIRNLSQLY